MRRSLLPEEAVQSLHSETEAREAAERSGDEKVMHCLIKAYFKNICKLASNGSYVPVNLLNDEGSNEGNIDVEVHEDSVLHMIRRVWERRLFHGLGTQLGAVQGHFTGGWDLHSRCRFCESPHGRSHHSQVLQVSCSGVARCLGNSRARRKRSLQARNCRDPSYPDRSCQVRSFLRRESWGRVTWEWRIG